MAPTVASTAMTKITLSFLLSLMSDNNFQGPEAPANSKHHWAYKGPEGPQTWGTHYRLCTGKRQSPINILTASCEYDPNLEPIILDHFEMTSGTTGPCILNITNNGHAASAQVINENMRVRGGGLSQSYKTAEFHFHWGSRDDQGSEHALNGRKYPLEMHVVNFAEKYGTIQAAMGQPEGLAVLGVFFELSDMDNPYFTALDEALRHVHKAGEHTIISQLRLRSLLPEDLTRFWRYNGSLTTPYCFETVVWTIFAEPQKISRTQLETLRALLYEEGHEIAERGTKHSYTPSRLIDNWRPLQPLNGRVVKQSFSGSSDGFTPNNAFTDTKMSSVSAPLPTSETFSQTSNGGGSEGQNLDPMSQVPLSQVRSQQRSMLNEQKDRAQPHRATLNNQVGDQSANDAMGGKYFIHNSGSAASHMNSTSITTGSEHFRAVGSSIDTRTAYNPTVTHSGHIQKPSSPSVAEGAHDTPKTQQGHYSMASSGSNSADSSNNKNVVGQRLALPASEASPAGYEKQGPPSRKMSGESNANSATSQTHMRSFSPSYEIKSSASQTPFHTAQDIAVVKQNQPSPNNHREQHVSPQENQNSRAGFIDNRIAELANQIRLHRQHGLTHQNHKRPQSNISNLALPPVVRHNQPRQPVSQAQQNLLYAQSRQHNDLQQQRQQIQHMNRPPTAQQLRAILERLAATNRVNARPATITSGAASIPRGLDKTPNSVAGSVSNNMQHPPGAVSVRGPNGPLSSSMSSARSSDVHPTASTGYGSEPLLSQPNYSPDGQHRPNIPHEAYQQQMLWHQQQNLQQQKYQQQHLQWQQQRNLQQEAYQQQMQLQQQHLQQNPQHNYFPRTAPAASGAPIGDVYGQPTYSVNTLNTPHVFLTNNQQPVRIRRPVPEQINNWQQPQYQGPIYLPSPDYF